MRRRVQIAIAVALAVLAVLTIASAAFAAGVHSASPVKDVGDAVVQTGAVFGKGGTDGLILYGMILGTFLMFLALLVVSWLNYRERMKSADACSEQAKAFATASMDASDALRDVATAIASSGSANMTFQQSQAAMLERLELVLLRMDPRPIR